LWGFREGDVAVAKVLAYSLPSHDVVGTVGIMFEPLDGDSLFSYQPQAHFCAVEEKSQTLCIRLEFKSLTDLRLVEPNLQLKNSDIENS
jgi:hypothetical protein